MKLSARNIIPGQVISVKRGPISSLVVLQIAPDVQLTSVVTADAARALKLKKGAAAFAVIKSSSVMLGVDD